MVLPISTFCSNVGMRRLCVAPAVSAVRYLTLSADARADITRGFTKVKDEAKGQSVDLSDMSEAARNAHKIVQDIQKRHPLEEDKAFRAKLNTVNASLKAYNSRLLNLQNEARGIQNDVEKLLKVVWGQEGPGVESAEPVPSQEPAVNADFETEVPPLAEKLEQLKSERVPNKATEQEQVEHVDAEPVVETPSATTVDESEIEVESVEVDGSSVDDTPITDITRELHDKGIDFSDCLDAKSLRKRYREYLDGKFAEQAQAAPRQKSQSPQTDTPPKASDPKKSTSWYEDEKYQQYRQQAAPNQSEKGVTIDPNPGANRRMIDPMKYVRELKVELAAEHNVPPERIDLWSGKMMLDDNRRVYEYPGIQHNPVEIRAKGDVPK